jgi:hypothetical protein
MAKDASQLSFVFKPLEQRRSDKDRAPGQSKRIDGFPVPQNME